MTVKNRAQLEDSMVGTQKQRVVNHDLLDSLALKSTPTRYVASGTLNVSAADQDIPGLTTGAFTPTQAEIFVVEGAVIVDASAGTGPDAAGDTHTVKCNVDGAADAKTFIGKAAAANGTICIPFTWILSLTAAAHTIKLTIIGSAAKGQVVVDSYMVANRRMA